MIGIAPTNAEILRSAATWVFIHSFTMLLADTIRRAHPIAAHQFQIVTDGASLAPGLRDADPREIVTSAWIDLSEGPVILSLPYAGGRHCTLTLVDSGGETFSILGPREREGSVANVALVGPDHRGEAPRGPAAKRAPSNRVWAIARCYAHSVVDRPKAMAAVREQYIRDLTTTGERLPMGSLATSGVSCLQQATELSASVFFHRIDSILRAAPRHTPAHSAIAALRSELGGPPPSHEWSAAFAELMAEGLRKAVAMLRSSAELYAMLAPPGHTLADFRGGWADPGARPREAWWSLGAPAVEDLLTAESELDSLGRPLVGEYRYRLHFRSDALPPARAFWWISTRPSSPSIPRTGLGDRSEIAVNDDGSLDLFIQAEPPAPAYLTNWIPAPPGVFTLRCALHGPSRGALNRSWRLPPIVKLDDAAAPEACMTSAQPVEGRRIWTKKP